MYYLSIFTDEADLQRCEGDEVVMMQRGFGSGEIPNRKIDFKQHFEWYMKGQMIFNLYCTR